mmetsp:Transcript_82926/g.130745  ORF Transcript_82926/g.130745 Transcript_82926/m.130745 type:complete len:261 (-) Transcript_82926:266-1048(-)
MRRLPDQPLLRGGTRKDTKMTSTRRAVAKSTARYIVNSRMHCAIFRHDVLVAATRTTKGAKPLWLQRTAAPSPKRVRRPRSDLNDVSLGRTNSFPEGSGNQKSKSIGNRGVDKTLLMKALLPIEARTQARHLRLLCAMQPPVGGQRCAELQREKHHLKRLAHGTEEAARSHPRSELQFQNLVAIPWQVEAKRTDEAGVLAAEYEAAQRRHALLLCLLLGAVDMATTCYGGYYKATRAAMQDERVRRKRSDAAEEVRLRPH